MRAGAVVLVLGLVMSGCAGAGDGDPTHGYLAVVSETTVEARHARIALGIDDEPPTSFEGVVDLETGDMDVRGSLGVPAAAMAGGLDDDGQVVTLGEPDPVAVHVVVVGDTSYFAAEGLGMGGYVATTAAAQPSGDGVPAADPAVLLGALEAEGADAEEAGVGEVRGDPTRQLRIESTVAAGYRRQGVQLAPGTVLEDVGQTVLLDIDEQDRLRRVAVTSPAISTVDGVLQVGEGTTTTWWELWDFGVDATVEVPSPVVEQDAGAAGHSLLSEDDPFPLIVSSGSSSGGDGGWAFERSTPAIGATAAEAVARVVDDQLALLTGAGWTATEEQDGTPERRRFTLSDGARQGTLVVRFHPEGADVVLEGQVDG